MKLTTALAASIFLTLAMPVAAMDVQSEIDACDQALQAGDHAQATLHAEQALGVAPDSADAYLCLGRALGAGGQHDKAVAALQSADRLLSQPLDRIVALTLLGNQYLSAKDYQAAAKSYRQSLEVARAAGLTPYQRINLNLVGASLQGSGDIAGALEHYLQGMQFAANDNERADNNERIASAYSLLGQHDQAISHQLQAMLQQERSGDLNHWANASIELGRICLVAKEYRDAEKWLGKFLAVIPQAQAPYWEAKGHYMMGRVKAAQGRQEDAAVQFAKGRALLASVAGAEDLLKAIAAAEAEKTM